jgi:hypothetical protein
MVLLLKMIFENKFITSKHFEDGKIISSKRDEVSIKSKQEAQLKNENNPDASYVADATCIDWYWQTWVDGVLESEIFLYTTCNSGGGSGGGTSNGPNANCNYLLSGLNSITHTVIGGEIMSFGAITTNPVTGKVTRGIVPKGSFHTYNILGYRPTYRTFYSGSIYKDNINDSLWKFESFTFDSFRRCEGSLPPFFSEHVGSTIIGHLDSESHASGIGSFTIEFRLDCSAFGSTQVRFYNGNIYEGWSPYQSLEL